jgi:uncharacterized membrane protein YgcG
MDRWIRMGDSEEKRVEMRWWMNMRWGCESERHESPVRNGGRRRRRRSGGGDDDGGGGGASPRGI